MEMTLNLTYEDGMKVVEAMKEAAIENGWDAEELDECGIIEEYSRAVDAALAAMGISVDIDANPSYEDEDFDEDDFDFEDEEEDDNDVIYSLTAKGKFVMQYMEAGYPFEEACEVANILFGSSKHDDEDEEDEEASEDEDEDEELPSDEEVMNLIMRVLYGQ